MLDKVKIFANGNFLPVVEHEIIAVKYPANSTATRFMFPDVPNLRDSEIIAFEVYTQDVVPVSPDDGVTQVVNIASANRSFITLQAYNGNNFYQQSPYLSNFYFPTTDNPHERFQKQMQAQRINYPKSYIDFFPGAPVANDFVWLISVYYLKRSDLKGLMSAEFRKQS